jgi:hypothetical protein
MGRPTREGTIAALVFALGVGAYLAGLIWIERRERTRPVWRWPSVDSSAD